MKYIVEPQIISYINKAVDTAIEKVVNVAVDKAVDKASKKSQIQSDESFRKFQAHTDESFKKFEKRMDDERGVIFEKFQSDLKTMGETVDFRIREVTREVIHEEVVPRFDALETKMDMFIVEMKALRKDSNYHNTRLTRLERASA